ncbi:MAG: bifunctional nuclease family protein [Deltaproteobacteria bacterium]|nr:bifunctional nuclease family protein [Deltaproteobacteria bacterium]
MTDDACANNEEVQMTVAGVTLDPTNNMPIIILKDVDDTVAIPIWIGLVEASAIATELEGIQLARPMTHDLLKSLLVAMGGKLTRIVVNDLKDGTFYASLYIERDGESLEVDSRPSDAIALALRAGAQIFATRKVIDSSQQLDMDALKQVLGKEEEQGAEGESKEGKKKDKDRWTEILENLKPEDFGKYKM